jgi:prepilin-type N-terminal cleavage/methylation domain-containing protein
MKGGRSAFTLIEIMVVIVIIGIAAAMAVPMISSGASFQIRSAANLVAADLEYAKSMAISRGQSYKVVFNAATESYQIQDSGNQAVSPPGRKDTVNFSSDSRLSGVVIDSVNFGGSGTVTFDYLGSPQQGLSSEGVVTLKAGGITKTVKVEPVTGFISVE